MSCFLWCSRQESNLYYKIRNLAFYPLNYEGNGNGGQVSVARPPRFRVPQSRSEAEVSSRRFERRELREQL